MIHQAEEATAWLREPLWNNDWKQIGNGVNGISGDGILDKISDDKLARDVDELSSLFVELEEGTIDLLLPTDENVDVPDNWIGELEKDAVNVDELSAFFDQLVSEKASPVALKDEDTECDSDDDEEEHIPMVPCAPAWVMMAPLDPRSVIRTPVFKDLDCRIPRVQMPRIDLSFGQSAIPVVKPVVKTIKQVVKKSEYEHNPSTCWICKSDKSPYKKFALHRYLQKRHRRNWKRGPRYSGRSNVATSRVRDGGRFIQTAQWV